MSRTVDTDYLVIGAGAMGMAFTDALIDHADAHVTMVDRRHGPGGHWLDAYPFVRLHQASLFYGVASTPLGAGTVQCSGPETGLHERASMPEVCAYYDAVLHRRFLPSGRVAPLFGSDYQRDGSEHVVVSRISGERTRVRVRRRVVDATYLAPTIPATTPPPFAVADGARVVAVNRLADPPGSPGTYVIVGSGKTATDAIVWLIGGGLDPDRIVWIRPRDPWMLNRAVVQPDPVIFLGMGATIMEAAAEADSVDAMFARLEDDGVMMRIDPAVVPTMARTPTLAAWELDRLRSVERVVRLGHVRAVRPGEIDLTGGILTVPRDALVVHCAAAGLQLPPILPIWDPDCIRLQTIRSGFPCFCAALAGYVEATRDNDYERNRICPPNVYSNSLAEWSLMQVRGTRAARIYGAEPDIDAWANRCALNPARIDPARREEPDVKAVLTRSSATADAGLAGLARFAGVPS